MQRTLLGGMGTLFVVMFALSLRDPSSLRYPLIYPQLLMVAVAAVFYLIAVRDGRVGEGNTAAEAGAATNEVAAPVASRRLALLRFFSTVALAVLYVATWEWAGYFLDTLLFTALLLIALGERKPIVVVGLPVMLTVVVYLVFFRLLHLPLPLGPLEGLLL